MKLLKTNLKLIRIVKFLYPAFWSGLLMIIGIIFFAYSCQKHGSELPVISPVNSVENALTLHDIADDLMYIKLDNSVLLSTIQDTKKIEGGYLVQTVEGLFYYNNNGKLITQIGHIGGGPGECLSVESFTYDHKRKQVYLTDGATVMVYDLANTFIRSFKPNCNFSFSQIIFNNDYLYYPLGVVDYMLSQHNEAWIKTDLNGIYVQAQSQSLKDIKSGMYYRCNLCFSINESLFYWNELNDTIFKINGKSEPAYLFANDELRLTRNDLISYDNFRNRTSWCLLSILGSKPYLIFNYWLSENGRLIYAFYDQTKNQMFIWAIVERESQNINSYDNGLQFIPKSVSKHGDKEYLIGWANAFEIKALIASDAFKTSTPKYPEKKKELEKLANSLNENDNPVLMLVKLKE